MTIYLVEEPTMNPLHKAIDLSKVGATYGGPVGAVVMRGSEMVGQGFHSTATGRDPTAHAVVMAIRDAGRFLKCHDLSACTVHVSCEPCALCIGAICCAGITKVYYASAKHCPGNPFNSLTIPPDAVEFIQAKEPERVAADLVIEGWRSSQLVEE